MKFRKAGALIITGCMIMSFCACAGRDAVEVISSSAVRTEKKEPEEVVIDREDCADADKKEETVKVKADASGKSSEITVETVLLNTADSAGVIDSSELSGIRNMEGDEEFEQEEETLWWQNGGGNITYRGSGEKALPVDVKVTYYLNGEETAPEDMAGASGEIKIRFDYENRTYEDITVGGETINTPVPFAAVSLVPMPGDTFSDIGISSGRVINLGGENLALGYAFAGVSEFLGEDDPESMGTEFYDYVEITAEAEDFSLEFTETILTTGFFRETDTDSLDELLDLQDAVEELKDISDEMCDAVNELSDGSAEFKGYLDDYVSGAGELSNGAYSLSDGLYQIYSNTDLCTGAESLKAGITGLKTMVQQYQQADKNKENAELYAGLLAYIEQLESGAGGVSAGVYAYREAVGSAYSGAAALADGAYQLSEAGTELADGFSEVTDGVGEFKDAVDKFRDEGVKKMEEEAGEDPIAYVNKMKALKEADTKYTNYGGVRKGVESEVRFLVETGEIKK